jgi:hypothetical protein
MAGGDGAEFAAFKLAREDGGQRLLVHVEGDVWLGLSETFGDDTAEARAEEALGSFHWDTPRAERPPGGQGAS